MITLISVAHLKLIVQFSGQAIRKFLTEAEIEKFTGEAVDAITSFRLYPQNYSDEKLIAYGSNIIEAINYPVRIEIRGLVAEGAAQMVAKGIWGENRIILVEAMRKKCHVHNIPITLTLAGSSSVEFNVTGVNKSLPISFLEANFENILQEINYSPGDYINSFKTKTVIAADGDGTIYAGPRVGQLPSLADSPVRDVLIKYLEAGGIFMLISGNDLGRTFKRLVNAIPEHLYCRLLIAANGGADFVYVNSNGEPTAISGYHNHALDGKGHRELLDIVYIGDDGSPEGNDHAAFKAVGFKNAVLVAPVFLPGYDPVLESSYVGGSLEGTRKYVEFFLSGRMKGFRHNEKNCACDACAD